MKHMKTLFFCLIFSILLWQAPIQASTETRHAVIFNINGPIGPATANFVHHSLQSAYDKHASLIIIRMDTPGGLDSSMREIIRDMLASPIPIIVYVTPSGARAASAGAYILYASHLSAMTPGTNIGAATPIQIETPFSPANPLESADKKGPELEDKILSDAVAFIKSLAEIQGRNKVQAERFISEAASLSAEEAYKTGVTEIIANNLQDLLHKANGRDIKVLGQEMKLDTADLNLEELHPDWRTQLLEMITNPNIAYLLLIIGMYGLIFEFMNPGTVAPGVVGAIALLLGLYALHILPISYSGLALILIGISFMVAEVYIPSLGALGIGGFIAFIIGSIMLLDTDIPGFYIYWPLILTVAILSAGFILLVSSLALRALKQPAMVGHQTLLHQKGIVLVWKHNEGMIKLKGETWRAKSHDHLRPGDDVIVEELEGLILSVKKYKEK